MGEKQEHTPGPWEWRLFDETSCRQLEGNVEYCDMNPVLTPVQCSACAKDGRRCLQPREADARLIAAAPDLSDQVRALAMLGWDVARVSLYDEEGVEGWRWTEPDGTEHAETGAWDEWPPWPETARSAIAKARGE